MRKTLLFLGFVLLSFQFKAQTNYVSFTLTGLNEDVVAETSSLDETTTSSVDILTGNYCFITQDVGSTYGLPIDGAITYGDIPYQLAPYTGNNSLRLIGSNNPQAGAGQPEEGNPISGSVTFSETEKLEVAYLAVTSGSGASPVSGTINFDDASTQAFSFTAPDWYGSGTRIVTNLGRGNRSDNTLSGTPSGGPYIFQFAIAIDIANQSKNVTGISFHNDTTSQTIFNLFAVSGKKAAPCPSPSNISLTAVTAYDADLTWDAYDVNDTFEVAIVPAGDAEPTEGIDAATNTYNFTDLTPDTSYDVYVRTVCSPEGYSYWTGPFNFSTPVSCVAPTGLTVSSITTSTAEVSWDAGTATDWEFTYVPAGDPEPSSGTPLTTNSSSLSELTDNTSYDVYVRANCGTVDGYSTWTTTTFTTTCLPASGINEGFEDTNGGFPNCWSVINGGSANTWTVENSTTYSHSGSKVARIRYNSAAHSDYLITPAFTVTANVSDIISFWARSYLSYYIEQFDVMVSTTGNQEADFTNTLASNVAPPASYTEYTYDLSAYIGQTIYFAIKATSQNEYYLYIDDLATSGAPLCEVTASDLTASTTPTTATLSWTDATASSWEILVQNANLDAPDGATNGVTVTETTYEATNSTTDLQEFYVRSLCPDGTNYSPWVGPVAFGGGYAPIDLAGFNADVIANGIGDSSVSAPQDIDGSDYAFFSKDFKATEGSSDLTYGLPINGTASSQNTANLTYKFNSYSENNSLRMVATGVAQTLTVSNAYPAEKVFLLVTAGSGSGMISGTIHFDDNSTQTFSSSTVPDWFNSNTLPVALSGFGRINTSNNNTENPSGNPRLYELGIDLEAANQSKTISSIDITKDSGGGIVNIFAASIKYSSATLSVEDINNLPQLSVYPNPVKDNLYINAPEQSSIKVYNILGKEMFLSFQNNTINMSSLSNGIYLVEITHLNQVKTFKVIKD
ncbi:T9SS-dependent choice-of-anchor J family protein [Mangrovimonas sp. DI 80]|uniref:T9SS-dependent choice-of-anchor J family protein n=1 Tax=Mangrovimonas sp. DI 80 TaxID=1779330 RepID=UPI000978CCC6|nr:choice-of-anchor J domain-containing protein [Mangrovimonas sp. DI 80]OMP30131.1 hypothetical protein BKM32_12130 [Mangrovimonas sp. DI 80]